MSRLNSIIVIAISAYFLILGFLLLITGFLLLLGSSEPQKFAGGIIVFLFGSSTIFGAIAVLRLKMWGRMLILGISTIDVVLGIYDLARDIFSRPETLEAAYLKSLGVPFMGALLLISFLSFVYLILPQTKIVFLKK